MGVYCKGGSRGTYPDEVVGSSSSIPSRFICPLEEDGKEVMRIVSCMECTWLGDLDFWNMCGRSVIAHLPR
jgi:hypothetical protein